MLREKENRSVGGVLSRRRSVISDPLPNVSITDETYPTLGTQNLQV